MVEVVNEPDVRPMIGDADQFDAVAAIRRRGSFSLSSAADGFVGGVGTQRVLRGFKPVDSFGALFQPRSATLKSQHRRGSEGAARQAGVPASAPRSPPRKSDAPQDRQCGVLQTPTHSARPTEIRSARRQSKIPRACHRRSGGSLSVSQR
jgi:hypothetical protein